MSKTKLFRIGLLPKLEWGRGRARCKYTRFDWSSALWSEFSRWTPLAWREPNAWHTIDFLERRLMPWHHSQRLLAMPGE